MGSQKVHYTLSDEAIAIVARRAESPNKRGEWISGALIDYDAILRSAPYADQDQGVLEQIVNRLDRMEKLLSLLVAGSRH